MKASTKTATKLVAKATKPRKTKNSFEHGDYVLFNFGGRKHKGRIAIENDILYICQNVYQGGNCNETFGHESTWAISNLRDKSILENHVRSYEIENVSKAVWDKHVEPELNTTMGYGFRKVSKGRAKNPTYSFGCGAVQLTKDQIHEFADNRDEYLAIVQKRDELEKKLRAQITGEHERVTKWLTDHPGANTVLTVLRQRNIRPERTNPERLKRLFK